MEMESVTACDFGSEKMRRPRHETYNFKPVLQGKFSSPLIEETMEHWYPQMNMQSPIALVFASRRNNMKEGCYRK
ncbi:hypothetical protein PIB30_023848 [Stylosanthes scabra]|uniref:Uncharacterized protein n=1 Tax=Stylosanthes scabra TaxID=79078 RepID=A0ABU6R9W2_9FABA|nr:hypothetical protein [Stylosanthes scabra]